MESYDFYFMPGGLAAGIGLMLGVSAHALFLHRNISFGVCFLVDYLSIVIAHHSPNQFKILL
jgi:hypothetical protein